MKKTKKGMILLVTVLLVSIILIGCSNKPKVTAEDSVKAMFNLCIKGDQTDILKMGMTTKQVEEVIETRKQTFNTELKKAFNSQGLIIKDEQIKQIFDARNEALKKLTPTTEVASKSDEAVNVKLKSTYINEMEISKKAATDAIKQVGQQNKSKLTDAYINNLIQAYKNAKPIAGTKEKLFKCTIQEKLWLPESASQFGKDSANLAIGM